MSAVKETFSESNVSEGGSFDESGVIRKLNVVQLTVTEKIVVGVYEVPGGVCVESIDGVAKGAVPLILE